MHLGLLKQNQIGIIKGISINCKGEMRQRLLELGFIKNSKIKIQCISPLKDPISYNIHNTTIALRYKDAKHILIETPI